jgi:hypothetical protein
MIKLFEEFTKNDFLNSLGINFNEFNLTDEQFDCRSPHSHHGVNHEYRVMLNTLMIGYDIKDPIATRRAFMGAYIHDMGRTHDNWCDRHGMRAVRVKLPLYEDLFRRNGATDEDIDAIKLAVVNHSDHAEISKKHEFYKSVALLRDSDAIDLARVDMVVKPELLRFKESLKYIPVLEKLYIEKDGKRYESFKSFMEENMSYYD